jgi:hypothetical protein
MHGMVAPNRIYGNLAPVERGCRDPKNTKFLEGLFRDAYEKLRGEGTIDTDPNNPKEFTGMNSKHECSFMIVSKFPADELKTNEYKAKSEISL